MKKIDMSMPAFWEERLKTVIERMTGLWMDREGKVEVYGRMKSFASQEDPASSMLSNYLKRRGDSVTHPISDTLDAYAAELDKVIAEVRKERMEYYSSRKEDILTACVSYSGKNVESLRKDIEKIVISVVRDIKDCGGWFLSAPSDRFMTKAETPSMEVERNSEKVFSRFLESMCAFVEGKLEAKEAEADRHVPEWDLIWQGFYEEITTH